MTELFDLVDVFRILLLTLLVICAVCASLSKKPLTTVVVYMSYSTIMAVIWILLRSPDLAITEAAVGAGVSTILFFVCLRKVGGIGTEREVSSVEPTQVTCEDPEDKAQKEEDHVRKQ